MLMAVGGDDRRRLHGGVRTADAQRDVTRARNSAHVAGSAVGSARLHDPTQAV